MNTLGGDPAGKHIYNRGSANGKRVQCNMGAKNHGVIMPDANKEYTINQLVGAAFGAAGQRCMALTTAVMVGDSQGGNALCIFQYMNIRKVVINLSTYDSIKNII